MRLLVLADIHGDRDALDRILESVEPDFDAVIAPGDFTDMFSEFDDFSQMDAADMIIQRLLSLGKPLFCVPGNHDPYELVQLFKRYGMNIHSEVKEMEGRTIAGFGGAPTPFNTTYEPNEEETTEALDAISGRMSKDSILVIHNPPYGTKLDVVSTGQHVGSKIFRDFIEKHQPALAVSAHIHESMGTDRLGNTTLFYPGPVFGGRYGTVDLEKGVVCNIHKA